MSKLTLTLEHVDPKHPNSMSMAQTIGLLAQLIDLPSGGLKLTINCGAEDMESYADDLRNVLSRRPVGIRVMIDKQSKEEIERSTMASVTPMDREWGEPDSVTLSSRGRSVTLDAQTRRNADEMQANASALFPGKDKTAGEKTLDWLVAREERQA